MTKFIQSVALLFLFNLVQPSAMAAKPALVLLPVQGVNLTEQDKDNYRIALQEGMSGRYTVYGGAEVEKKLRKYSAKTCDANKCLQEVAIAFQGELVGRLVVTSMGNGYLLAIEIKNIFDDKVVESRNIPCEGCNNFSVIRRLKALGGGYDRPSENGLVAISTLPEIEDANIYIDGMHSGIAPSIIELTPGKHAIKIESANYIGESEIEVYKGDHAQVELELEALKGWIQLATIPSIEEADVYIDGEYNGQVSGTFELLPGKHAVEVKSDNYVGEREFEIKGGEKLRIDLALKTINAPVSRSAQPEDLSFAEAESGKGFSLPWWGWVLGAVVVGAAAGGGGDSDNSASTTGTQTGDVVVTW